MAGGNETTIAQDADVSPVGDATDPHVTPSEPTGFALELSHIHAASAKTNDTSLYRAGNTNDLIAQTFHQFEGNTDPRKIFETQKFQDAIANFIRANPDKLPQFTFEKDGSVTYKVPPDVSLDRIAIRALRFQHGPGFRDFTPAERLQARNLLLEANPGITADKIQAGQILKIPDAFTKRAEATTPQEVKYPGPPEVTFEVAGASPEFQERVGKFLSTLPDALREKMLTSSRIRVVGDMRDQDPNMFYQKPDGHPVGVTWGHVLGAHVSAGADGKSTVIIPEWVIGKGNILTRNESFEYSAGHEIGHALDAALGNLSKSPEFSRTYGLDYNRMTADRRAVNIYFTQGYKPGNPDVMSYLRHGEAFAEINSEILNASWRKSIEDRRAFINDFRKTFELQVSELLKKGLIGQPQLETMAQNGFLTERQITQLGTIHKKPGITMNLLSLMPF